MTKCMSLIPVDIDFSQQQKRGCIDNTKMESSSTDKEEGHIDLVDDDHELCGDDLFNVCFVFISISSTIIIIITITIIIIIIIFM